MSAQSPRPQPDPQSWTDLDKTCPACRFRNHRMALRCKQCGHNLLGAPQAERAPSVTGPTLFPPAFDSSTPNRPAGNRSLANLLIAFGLVVSIAGAAATVLLVRPHSTVTRTPSPAPGQLTQPTRPAQSRLALAFHPGTTTRYRLTMQMNGTASAHGRSAPLEFTVSENLDWKVLSIDQDGTANIEVIESHVRLRVNGHTQWIDAPAQYFEITPHGQVLSDGEELFSGIPAGVRGGQLLVGGQLAMGGGQGLFAILPGRKARPGETWTKKVAVKMLGSPLGYTATSTYLRTERIGAREAAVVQTSAAIPVNLVVRLARYTSLFGIEGQVPYKALFHEVGRVNELWTSWIDARSKDLLKTSTVGHLAVQVWTSGATGDLSITVIAINSTLSMTLQRR